MEDEINISSEDKVSIELLNPPKEKGMAPTDKETGRPIELHYDGLHTDKPWRELTWKEHRGKVNYNKYHDINKELTTDNQSNEKQNDYINHTIEVNTDLNIAEENISEKFEKSKLRNFFEELSQYNTPLFKSYDGTTIDKTTELEKKLGYILPQDFKEFLFISNGAIINCNEVYGIYDNKAFEDLYGNYIFEKDEVGNPIRDYYLPIYPDGMGNHNCLDLKSLSSDGEKCNVVFWQHDRFYSEGEEPDIDAKSFTEFLENLLKEISENYN